MSVDITIIIDEFHDLLIVALIGSDVEFSLAKLVTRLVLGGGRVLEELAADSELLGDPARVFAGEGELLASELEGESLTSRIGGDVLEVVVSVSTNEDTVGRVRFDTLCGETEGAVGLAVSTDLPSAVLEIFEGVGEGGEGRWTADVLDDQASEGLVLEDFSVLSAFQLFDLHLDTLGGPVRAVTETGVGHSSISTALLSIELGLDSVFGLVGDSTFTLVVIDLALLCVACFPSDW